MMKIVIPHMKSRMWNGIARQAAKHKTTIMSHMSHLLGHISMFQDVFSHSYVAIERWSIIRSGIVQYSYVQVHPLLKQDLNGWYGMCCQLTILIYF